MHRSRIRRAVLVAVLALCAAAMVYAWTRRPNAEGLAARANLAMQQRDYARVVASLRELAGLRPLRNAESLVLAEAESYTGASDAAVERLAAIGDGDPLAAHARLIEGQIERRRNRMRYAEAALLKCLHLDPKTAQARRELIYVYGMQARRRELAEQIEHLGKLVPLNRKDLMLWTVSVEDVWLGASIRGDLEGYLNADPDDQASRLALAEVLLRDGRKAEAEAILAPITEDDPRALPIRVRIALDEGSLEKAQALLDRAEMDRVPIARLKGQLALRSNNISAAVDALRLAVRLEPTSQEAAQTLAIALKRAGLDEEVEGLQIRIERLRALTRLLEESRSGAGAGDKMIPKRMAEACEAIGRVDLARGWYSLALEIDVLDRDVQRAIHRLNASGADSEKGFNALPSAAGGSIVGDGPSAGE